MPAPAVDAGAPVDDHRRVGLLLRPHVPEPMVAAPSFERRHGRVVVHVDTPQEPRSRARRRLPEHRKEIGEQEGRQRLLSRRRRPGTHFHVFLYALIGERSVTQDHHRTHPSGPGETPGANLTVAAQSARAVGGGGGASSINVSLLGPDIDKRTTTAADLEKGKHTPSPSTPVPTTPTPAPRCRWPWTGRRTSV